MDSEYHVLIALSDCFVETHVNAIEFEKLKTFHGRPISGSTVMFRYFYGDNGHFKFTKILTPADGIYDLVIRCPT